MQSNEFIERVQRAANLSNQADAEQIIAAVFGTLGELIYRTELRELAAQLPGELQDLFYKYQPRENTPADTQHYRLEDFYHRVQARAGRNSYPTTVNETKAVIGVLEEAISAGAIADAVAALPDEFRELFGSG